MLLIPGEMAKVPMAFSMTKTIFFPFRNLHDEASDCIC